MFYGKAIGKYRQFSRVVGWALEATGAAAHGNTDQVLNNGPQTGLGSCFFDAGATGTLPGKSYSELRVVSWGPNSGDLNPILDTILLGNSPRAMASVAVGILSASVPEPKSLAGLVINPAFDHGAYRKVSARSRGWRWVDHRARTSSKQTDRERSPQTSTECRRMFGRREGNFRLIAKQKLATGPITSAWPVTHERSPPC
jgi:hypothetical protein